MHLADLAQGTRSSIAEVSAAADAPPGLMSKVLQRLTKAQLVVSRRGRTGGYRLARPADRISLLDIVVAIEGPLCFNVCLGAEGCDRRSWCAAHLVWAEVQRKVASVLGSASLEELARGSAIGRASLGIAPAS